MASPYLPNTISSEPKEEDRIVSTKTLSDGRINYFNQKAQNLVPIEPYQKEASYSSLNQAMHGVGAELANPQVNKDKAWWQKALGVLEPLKYLQIPMELVAQAAIDPISIATGRQLSPLRGSAEREQFEGWKALFGGDMSPETGWGEVRARLDKAAEGTEKRPLKMQLFMMGAEIAATGGGMAVARLGARAGSMGGRVGAKAGSIGLRSLDPTDVAFGVVGKGVKKGWNTTPWAKARKKAKAGKSEIDIEDFQPVAGGAQYGPHIDKFRLGQLLDTPVEERALGSGWNVGDPEGIGGGIFPANARYGESNAIFPVSPADVNPLYDPNDVLEGFEDGLSPVMHKGNLLRKLFHDLWKPDDLLKDTAMASEDTLTRSRDVALLSLILSTGSRKGTIENLKVGEISEWLDDFKKTKVLKPLGVSEMSANDIGKTFRSNNVNISDFDTVFALDNLVYQLKANKLITESKGKITNSDAKIFDLLSTKGDSTEIIKKYNGMGYNLGPTARWLREQKASELYLEGWSLEDIANKLNHKDINVTRGYIRDWAIRHEDAKIAYRSGFELAAEIPKEVLDGIQDKALKQAKELKDLSAEWEKALDKGQVAAKLKKGAKGMIYGFQQVNEVADVIGDSFKQIIWEGDNVSQFARTSGLINDVDIAAFKNFTEARDHVSYDLVKENLKSALSLVAMRRLSQRMRAGKKALEDKQVGISKPYGGEADRMPTSQIRPGEGILNRAGYWINKKGVLHNRFTYLKKGKEAEVWRGRRIELAKRLGFENWTDTDWDKWASKLHREHDDIARALAEPEQWQGIRLGKGRIAGDIGRGGLREHWVNQGKTDGGQVYEILEHYIDNHNLQVVSDYKSLGEQMELQGGLGYLPFDDIITDLRIVGSGTQIGYGAAVKRFGANYIIARNAYEKTVEFSSALDPIVRKGAAQVNAAAVKRSEAAGEAVSGVVPEVGFLQKTTDEQRLAVQQWLGEDRIRQVLRGRHFYKDMNMDRAKSKLAKLAEDRPALFGNGFDGKEFTPAMRKEMLDDMAAIIFSKGDNGRSLADDFAERSHIIIDPDAGKFPRMRQSPLRQRFADVPDQLNGVSSDKGTGQMLSIDDTVGFINKGRAAHALNEWWNKRTWWKPVRPFISAIELAGSMVGGGRALFSRQVTKGISARAHNYSKAEDLGIRASAVANAVIKDSDLGLYIDDANKAQLAAGIDRGNEFLGNIKVKDLDEIMQWEQSHKGEVRPNTFTVLNGFVQADPTEAKKWLTQVDVVLERIEPQHWDKYFELNAKQKAGLVFLKDMLDEMDAKAMSRGVDVVDRVKKNGGEYLKNYFPRIYRFGRNTRLKEKYRPDAVLNSYAQQFEARDVPDIIHQLLNPRRKDFGVEQTVMDGVADRIGQYTETMWKEVIDHETIDWLRATDAFKAARGTKKEYIAKGEQTTKAIAEGGSRKDVTMRRLELESLRRIVNDKINGTGLVDPTRQSYVLESTNPLIKQFDWVVTSGDNNLESVRQGADRIQKFIKEEEMYLDELVHERYVKEIEGIDWLDNTMKAFNAEDQRAMRQMLTVSDDLLAQPLKILSNIVRKPSAILRTFKAGFDLGAPLIHGFNSAVRIPLPGKGQTQTAWLKSNKHMFELMAHPEHYDAWLVNNLDNVNDIGQFVRLGHAEPVRQMQSDEWYQNFKRWLTSEQDRGMFMGKRMGKSMQKAQVANRFETGFTGYLDMLRVENWKALVPSLERKLAGQNKQLYKMDDAGRRVLNIEDATVRSQLHELGAVVNKMTGVYDQHLAQITPYQSLIESSLFFFAPMYRRATYGIIFDIFRGGMRQREALQQLGGIITAGGILGGLASKAQGNEEFFDLDKPYKFGKFEVNGVRMGVGTAWWTAFRLATDIAAQFNQDPEAQLTEDTFKGHPLFEILKRRGRSQLAPGTSLAVDIVSGRTFVGDPLRDEEGDPDWMGIGQHIGRSAVPFWLDGAFAGGFGGAAVAMPAEALGLQAYPIQDYDILSRTQQRVLETWEDSEVKTWRVEQDRLGNKIDWTSAPKLIKDRIYDFHPEVSELYDTYKQNHGEILRGTARDMADWSKDNAQIELKSQQELTRATRQYMRGEIGARDLRTVLNQVKQSKRLSSRALMDEGGRYFGLSTFYSDLRNARSQKGEQFQGDNLYDKWVDEILTSEQFDDEEGNRIMGAYDRAEMQWRMENDITPEIWEYMQNRKNGWLNELSNAGLQPIADLLRAKEELKPYWDIHDSIWQPGSEMNVLAERYAALPLWKQQRMKKGNTGRLYRDMERTIRRARRNLRDSNINIDRLLVEWYGHSPRHKINTLYEESLRATQDSNSINGIADGIAKADDWEVRPSGRVSLKNRLTGVY